LNIDAISSAEAQLSEVTSAAVQIANNQISAHAETLKSDLQIKISEDLDQEMQAFQAQSLAKHQALLGQELTDVYESSVKKTQSEMQEQMLAMQANALAQMRSNFIEAMPEIYQSTIENQQAGIATEITENLNQAMQLFHQKAIDEHRLSLEKVLNQQFEEINNQAKLDLMEKLSLIQSDAQEQMQATIREAIPSIYEIVYRNS
jgi:pheromone shutdown protein TraB